MNWKKILQSDTAHISQRLFFTVTVLYVFFVYNALFSIKTIQSMSIALIVIFSVYQSLTLFVGFCFFRMVISKNCTTLELFPELEERDTDSSEESLHLNPFEEENLYREEKVVNICLFCKAIRPPRSYHCKDCNRCLLLMYKHSRWLDVCIGFTNYKFWVVFLFYSNFLAMLVLGCFIYVLAVAKNDEDWLFVPTVIATGFQAILWVYIVWELVTAVKCILRNETLQEAQDTESSALDPDVTYDLGRSENWKMIMGRNWTDWFLPCWSTSGDGLKFPTSKKIQREGE